MPYHLLLDTAGEARLGKLQIGTTRRGIGPCYADKAARLGIRVQDLLDEKILKKKIVAAMEPKRLSLRPFAKAPELDLQAMTEEYLDLRPPPRAVHRRHGAARLGRARRAAATSSSRAPRARCSTSTTARIRSSPRRTRSPARPCTGAGVGPKDIDEIWGVAKAYATRVGAGPFPTELDDELGDAMREAGGEFGTTTGRARRVGWLDLVALRYAARLNSLTHLAITKLDVLTGLGPLRVCTRYRGAERGELRPLPLPPVRAAPRASASTRSCPGWDEDIGECRDEDDLPQAARDYLAYIADFIGVPIALVGVGPGRDQMIWTEAGKRPRPPSAPRSPERRDASSRTLPVHADDAETNTRPRRGASSRAGERAATRASAIAVSATCTETTPRLGPVDVLELEQQRRLVERERRARAPNGMREPPVEPLVARDDRGAAPRGSASTIPGTKWWMWRPPATRRRGTGPNVPRLRMIRVRRRRATAERRAAKSEQEVEQRGLARGDAR